MEQIIYIAAFIASIIGMAIGIVGMENNYNLGKRRHTPTPED